MQQQLTTYDEPPEGAVGDVDNFAFMVREMCTKQDQMKEIAAERKVLFDQVKELREQVMEYMIVNKVKKCNYENDEIYVNKKEASGALSRTVLKNALDGFFEGDDSAAAEEEAEECFAYIIESLGKKEVTELKRTKRKATKKPVAPDAKKTKTEITDVTDSESTN